MANLCLGAINVHSNRRVQQLAKTLYHMNTLEYESTSKTFALLM